MGGGGGSVKGWLYGLRVGKVGGGRGGGGGLEA